jgi:hypothetical protein
LWHGRRSSVQWAIRYRPRSPTAPPPLRVFLSHTSELRSIPAKRSYVDAAAAAVRRARHAEVDMAYFSARDDSPADYCTREMAGVDVYVGIIGHRYGSPVPEDPERSYTELEFDTAMALKLPRLIFFVDPKPPGDIDDLRQQRFRRRLREAGVTTTTVTSPDQLELRLYQSLVEMRTPERTSPPADARTWVWPLTGAVLFGIIAVAIVTRAPPALAGPRQVVWAAIIGVAGALGGVAAGAATDHALRSLGRARSAEGPLVESQREQLDYRDHVKELVTGLAADHERLLGSPGRIQLALAERSRAVDDPRPVRVPRRGAADRTMAHGTSIGDAFDRMHSQMLILGAPGAGKTTTLLELAKQLLSDRQRTETGRLPVVFDLASWTPRCGTVAEWLVEELHKGYDVPPALGRRWLASNLIIPLMDGLDEVRAEHRDACVSALNRFRFAHGRLPLAVCSRVVEYEDLRTKLALRGAVVIQPLSREEVDGYLRRAGDALDGVRALLWEDDQLAELLTTPLFVGMVAMTYGDTPAAEALAHGTPELLRHRCIADYVEGMLHRRKARAEPPYRPDEVLRWLAWLAGRMRAQDRSVLNLDQMQPAWLASRWQRWLVTVGAPVIIGAIAGGPVGVDYALFSRLVQGPHTPSSVRILIGVSTGLIGLAVCAWMTRDPDITPSGPLRWSWRALRRGFAGWLATGMILGVSYGLVFGLVTALVFLVVTGRQLSGLVVGNADALVFGPVAGVTYGLLVGLVLGVTFGLLSGLDIGLDPAPAGPARGIRAWKRNAVLAGTMGGLLFGCVFWLVFGLGNGMTAPAVQTLAEALGYRTLYWPHAAIEDVLVAVLFSGLVIGARSGGGAYLRHLILHQLLVRDGRAPRDYIAFLDHATRLIFLRRKGGGYEFVHRILLEHFADLPVSWPAAS